MQVSTLSSSIAVLIASLVCLSACGNGQSQTIEVKSKADKNQVSVSVAKSEEQEKVVPKSKSVDLSSLPVPYSKGNFENGRRLFKNCSTCHSLQEGVHFTGPSLYSIFDAPVGSVPGFNYSGALKAADFVWSTENMEEWLTQPSDLVPGNTMNYAGMRRDAQRRDLIAYMLIETSR